NCSWAKARSAKVRDDFWGPSVCETVSKASHDATIRQPRPSGRASPCRWPTEKHRHPATVKTVVPKLVAPAAGTSDLRVHIVRPAILAGLACATRAVGAE